MEFTDKVLQMVDCDLQAALLAELANNKVPRQERLGVRKPGRKTKYMKRSEEEISSWKKRYEVGRRDRYESRDHFLRSMKDDRT